MILIYIFASIFLVSAASLIGLLTFPIAEEKLRKVVVFLVSFSAGTLLGDAFIHLIPQSFESKNPHVSISILAGLIFFFILEKFIHWRHCHEEGCPEHSRSLPYIITFGDALHNFIDGIIIAVSFLVSIPIGVATTIAVLFHEIPQEIGDFGVLIHSGFSKKKALLYNFMSALTAFVGAFMVVFLDSYSENIATFLIPFAAGGFIYIATADIIPELHKHKAHKLGESFKQLFFFILGTVIMWSLLFLE